MQGISIVICCYNAAARIGPTLKALQQQKFGVSSISWEVIIVDNASTDDTAGAADTVWQNNPVTGMRVVTESTPGLMHARHKGLTEAGYDIVSFIDDDNWVEDRWVEKINEVFRSDEKIAACGGRSEAVFENSAPDWFPLYENSFAVGTQMDGAGYIDNHKGYLWGAGLSFRKSIWEELNKRNFKNLTIGRQGKNITAGEDSELCYAFRLLGYRLYYRPDLALKHYMPEGRMTISYLERMTRGFGKANARLNCYRVLLDSSFYLHPWWYEWMVAVKNVFILSMLPVFRKEKKAQWDAKVRGAYNRGYAEQVWQDKGTVNKMIKDLRIVFNK